MQQGEMEMEIFIYSDTVTIEEIYWIVKFALEIEQPLN